jgi:hypothetical protein
MEQLDKLASGNILRAMSTAGVDLDEVVSRSGISKKILVERIAQGPWKLVELAQVAKAIGCPVFDLVPNEVAA